MLPGVQAERPHVEHFGSLGEPDDFAVDNDLPDPALREGDDWLPTDEVLPVSEDETTDGPRNGVPARPESHAVESARHLRRTDQAPSLWDLDPRCQVGS